MSTREKLNHSFEITRRLVHKFADGLSNVDSLAAIYDSERKLTVLERIEGL